MRFQNNAVADSHTCRSSWPSRPAKLFLAESIYQVAGEVDDHEDEHEVAGDEAHGEVKIRGLVGELSLQWLKRSTICLTVLHIHKAIGTKR